MKGVQKSSINEIVVKTCTLNDLEGSQTSPVFHKQGCQVLMMTKNAKSLTKICKCLYKCQTFRDRLNAIGFELPRLIVAET